MSEHAPRKRVSKEDVRRNAHTGLTRSMTAAEIQQSLRRRLKGLEQKSGDISKGTLASEVETVDPRDPVAVRNLNRKLDLLGRDIPRIKEAFPESADRYIDTLQRDMAAQRRVLEMAKVEAKRKTAVAKEAVRTERRRAIRVKDPQTGGYTGTPRYAVPAVASGEQESFGSERFERMDAIKANIKKLEAAARVGKRNVEPEVLKLENELRVLERETKGASKSTKPELQLEVEDTPEERKERIPNTDYGQLLNHEFPKITKSERFYEGPARYPVPAPLDLNKVEVPSPEVQLSSETAAENKVVLRKSVEEVQDTLAERAGVKAERDAMRAAGQRYFDAQKNLYKSGMGKADSGPEVEEAADAKHAYDKTRADYANALSKSAVERMKGEGYDQQRIDKVLERYSRLVRFNEVVKPGAELKLQARIEGLGEKKRNVFEKGLGLFAKGNQKLDALFGKKGARVVRAAASAIIVTGAAGAFGAFGTAGLLAVAGYGAAKFGRSLIGTSAGVVAGEGAGKFYERFIGRKSKAKAEKRLKTEGRSSGAAELNAEEFANIDVSREKLLKEADESTIQRRKNLVKALTALGVGAGTTAALTELAAMHHAAEVAAAVPHERVGDVRPTGSSLPPEHPIEIPKGVHIDNVDKLHLEIGTQHGDAHNMEQLVRHFQHQLRNAGYSADGANTPPGIRTFLSAKPHQFTNDYNFHSETDHMSARVFSGDGIKVDANGNVIFTQKGESVTLIDGSGNTQGAFDLNDHATVDPQYQPSIEAAPHEHATAHGDAGEIRETQALNRAQLHPESQVYAQPPFSSASSTGVRYEPPSGKTPPLVDMEGRPTGPTPPLVGMDEAIRSYGSTSSVSENFLSISSIDPSVPHLYGSGQGEYLFGGPTKTLLEHAQSYANGEHVSIFVNQSYNEFGGSRVVQVYEFKPGATAPIMHTEPKYDILSDHFTERID